MERPNNNKNHLLLMLFIIIITLVTSIKLDAQTFGVTLDGGRFMWRIEPKNFTATGSNTKRQNGIYPGDFRKSPASLNDVEGIQDMFILSDEDPHPWVEGPGGVAKIREHGSFNGDQVKYMRYAYPKISANGNDVGRFRDDRIIINPNLQCEMKGTNKAVNELGLTWYTTTYTWSHPEYQDIVVNHQQIVNDGYWYQWMGGIREDTVDTNKWNKVWIKLNREYKPVFNDKNFLDSGWDGMVNWNFWGHGVQDEITDSMSTLMYTWIPNNTDVPLEDEGKWLEEDKRFHHPYYFGMGLLGANGPLVDNPNVTSPLHWWGAENFEDELASNDAQSFKAFLKAKSDFNVDPGLFQKPYNNPHDRDPDGDEGQTFPNGHGHIRMNYYFGPFTVEIGDTINIWMAHLAGGIEPKEAKELGEEWALKYNPDSYTRGWSDEDIVWKNNILRTAGVNDMVDNYRKAQEIFKNGIKIPKMNLLPPEFIDVNSGGGFNRIEWAQVTGANSYNIYRAEGKFEYLVYDSIANVSSTINIYDDTTAVKNFTYYYYVTAVDEDGYESSHYVVRPQSELGGVSPASLQGNTMDDIRVVPNPFVFSPDGNYGPGAESRIVFAGLPGPCKITIFTLTGDIIDEIEHDKLSGSCHWDSKTKYNQFITPGLYIYHVESTNPDKPGEKLGKFIVIR